MNAPLKPHSLNPLVNPHLDPFIGDPLFNIQPFIINIFFHIIYKILKYLARDWKNAKASGF
jgi:hypothetical protein